MRSLGFWPGLLAVLFFACALPAKAQLSPAEPDPLARIRDAARGNVQACSATGETLCEQVAPKIIANAQGDSPLAENLRRLTEGLKVHTPANSEESPAVSWAVAAFRDAGVEVHTEKYGALAAGSDGEPRQRENVVAEIRGREKPEEWVLLGARLDSSALNSGAAAAACNAALAIEAARDIQLTGVHPRRSIRFVLFGGPVGAIVAHPDAGNGTLPEEPGEEDQRAAGARAYMRAHADELDKVKAAILYDAGANRMIEFELNGRRDIESGMREAMKPIGSMGSTSLTFDAPLEANNLDFLLEGIPTVVAAAAGAADSGNRNALSHSLDQINIEELKRNTAIAAVTAFGVAERAEPLGPRLSRAEIESLLKTSGLEQQMKIAGLWTFWESGERGRLP